MPNQFTERFKHKTDNELTRIVANPRKHVPEAVDVATEELIAREDGTSKYIDPAVIREERRREHELDFPTKKIKSKPSFRFI